MRAEFRRDVSQLDDVFRFVGSFFDAEGIDPAVRYAVDFAAEEIFTNFVKYNRDSGAGIEIDLSLRDGDLVMQLVDLDSGRFDINTDAPEVDINQPLEERTAGGLGVHLVKRMMDRVEYRHEAGKSTITLRKRLGENDARN